MMQSEGVGGELTFLDYLRPVRRFKFIVVLVVALAAAATYHYTNGEAKVYQTSTEVYVGQPELQQILNPTSTGVPAATLADEATFVTTPAVAETVRRELKLPYPPGALLGAVSVTPASGSDFLTITAQTSNPQLAAELANGFAKAYLQLSRSSLVGSARVALKAEQSRLLAVAPGPANATVRQALGAQIATLEDTVVSPPSVGMQLAPAAVPGPPTSPDPTRNAIFAAALALVLGVILSYLFDRRDRRILSLSELEALYEVPVLATVPHVRSLRAETRGSLYGIPIALREPHRTLRVNLELARRVRDAKVIMVTSALASEGKSMIVRNLAITYREAGARVAVVEGDLRRPVLAAQLGVDQGPGLSEALARDEKPRMQPVPDRAERRDGGDGRLDVLVAGTAAEDPTVLLTDERLRRLVTGLAAGYDLVLVDSPPVLLVGEALPLLSLVDGVIIVARAGTITYPASTRLRQTIEHVSRIHRVDVVGAVVNDIADELVSYYRPGARRERASWEDSVTPTPEHAAP